MKGYWVTTYDPETEMYLNEKFDLVQTNERWLQCFRTNEIGAKEIAAIYPIYTVIRIVIKQ